MSEKPIPKPYQDSAPYWEAAKHNQLLIQKCLECGLYQFYPRGVCHHCLSSSLSWFQAAGHGTVYSFTVNYRAPHPGFADDLPFITAIVELKEGVRMMTNIVQCEPDQVSIGMPVRVMFDKVTEDVTLPKFRPA